MIWDGCGDCKYAWPCGGEQGKEPTFFYCVPRERKCESHFGNFRDKECGLVEGITVGNLRKLLEGLEDSIVVDIWFHMSLTKLNKDNFFGEGTLAELYDWRDFNNQTAAEKEAFKNMILQRHPNCSFESSRENLAQEESKAECELSLEELDSKTKKLLKNKVSMTDSEKDELQRRLEAAVRNEFQQIRENK